MDTPIFQAIDEWTRLESALHCAKSKNQADAEKVLRSALAMKEREILESRAKTRKGALTHLRFCATYLERHRDSAELAVNAIRNAANVLTWP